ncbi:MAG: DUF2817 domain-containing protein [Gemmataceae bacterium]|nr:DUF2817 domain-containing protein [Gemmataceae bacterium]
MPFSPDYFAARARFRAAAARLGWDTHAYPVTTDPGGEPLTIDAALSPGPPAAPVLVVTSGVHGVEGFFGSAVQVAALEGWAKTGVPGGVRVVFVHAVCPSGFARVRRFDQDNIDLNRNFLLPGQEYTGCPPTYSTLDPVLNPKRPPSRFEFFTLRAVNAIARQGLANLKQAIAGGQYEFPRGIFFGGRGPATSHAILSEHFPHWLADTSRGALLDFHSGLGRWGRYTLLVDAPHTVAQLKRASRWFGRGVLELCKPEGTAYASRGGFDLWCPAQAGGRDLVSFCAEIGTFWTVRVLGAIRAENMAQHWGRPDDPATRRAKADLMHVFCPESAGWRRRAVEGGLRLIHQAAAGLTEKA